jgi:RES domain
VASWRAEPRRLSGDWNCYRQASPDWPPLYHAAGEPAPSQVSGRWHRQGEDYAQYLSLEPLGAWAELVRYDAIRMVQRAHAYHRRLWLCFVREHEIADLSTFDAYRECGLDPGIAVGDHAASQALADELRATGYRGLLSPSAALAGATNLTLFGERYERVMLGGLDRWRNPRPDLFVPCSLVVEGGPPVELLEQTTFEGMPHPGYRAWISARLRA